MCKANYTCVFLFKLPEAVTTTASHFGEEETKQAQEYCNIFQNELLKLYIKRKYHLMYHQ